MNMYYYVTIASNFVRGFDKYQKIYSKSALKKSTFSEQFFILKKEELDIGLNKARKLLKKVGIVDDFIIVLETDIGDKETHNDHETGLAQYIKQNFLNISNVYTYEKSLVLMRIEDLMAKSFELNFELSKTYENIQPRTISILPVKSGCQANCDFCFSTYSVSEDLEKGLLENDAVRYYLKLAQKRGATRAVITGGGEPTLIEHDKLLFMIREASSYFPKKVVMISNGYKYAMQNEEELLKSLLDLYLAGLTDLSISTHHYERAKNQEIMKLDTPIENILKLYQKGTILFNIRLICVLQKKGINSKEEIANYLNWAGSYGVEQVCFKELYVSTSSESYYHEYSSNDFSYENQVPLHLVLEFCEEHGFELIDKLPWGAPLYQGVFNGHKFTIAAYTEPSLFWELSHELSRSWNIMSNGECLASLEDKQSFIKRETDEF